ncbi:hypothetical protein Tco_0454538 [Tanacetum coccineum]
MAITAYVDTDHAACQDTRRSTSGSAQFLGDKVPLLYAATTSSTPGLNTSTSDIISSENKWRREWLSCISYFRLQPAFQNEESMSLKRQLFLTTVTIADINVNTLEVSVAADAPPTLSDEQILPRDKWVPVGKRNYFLDVERNQANPIYKIAMDILKNTNFFRAFTASSNIPSIYIQQFWDTIRFDKDNKYNCQLDEQRFYLTKATLRDALQLPTDNENFTPPPNINTIISVVNDLGYPNAVRNISGIMTNDMYQLWRAIATVINLCLMGKTSGFERSRSPVLQILWEDKMNLTIHVEGKKKVNPLVIPGVRFTKLIINHLQSRHRFHKRPGSPLHMPYDEYTLGYLKFSFKNTKRVRFGMTIPNTLITEDIRTASYYPEYVAKVAKYQRFLAGEEVSDDDAPPPKPAKGAKLKTTKKPTSTQQTKPKTKPSTTKTTKSTSSQPPKPKPAPAKPQEKKRKRVLDATEAQSQAKRSKAGRVSKKRTLQLRDEFIDEGVPVIEPRVDDEEAIVQKVLEESIKDAYPAHQGPLPPVVFREPDFGKLQPLPETPKKKNPVEQFIFQRRTPATAEPSSLVESSSLYAELGLTDSGTESDEEVSPEMNAQGQEEGQGRTNPGDAGMSQTPSSHVVHAGPNLDHMDLGIAEASSQPNTEQMDDKFTATAYPKVQENLKLPTEGEKSQEDEPEKTNTKAEVQSMVTVPIHQDTSSVPLLTTPVIDITDPQSDSTTVPASMPTTTATTIGQLERNITDLVEANQALEERIDKQGNKIHQFKTQDLSRLIREQIHAMRAPLRARFKDLPTFDMKEILLQRIEQFDADKADERTKKKSKQDSPKTPPGSPPPPPPLGASGASGPTGTSNSAQDPPPPPPSSTTNRGDQSHSSAAPGSSKTAASTTYITWTTTTSRLEPAASSVPADVLIHEESDFEAQDMGFDDEDSGSRHIPKVSLNQEWFKPLSEEKRPATPEPAWSIPSSSLLVPNNN